MAQTWRPSTCHGVSWQCVSVLTARQPFRWLANSFWSISIYFDLFQSISIYFNLFQSISIYFNLFQSISIYFNLFQPFWSILISSIYSNPFRFWHQNRQNISIMCWPLRSVSIQDQNCQNKASQASCTLSMWLHVRQPFMIPTPSWANTKPDS
jgi:hypothetical protein